MSKFRVAVLILALALALVAVGGCAPKLDASFDEAQVTAAAKGFIDLLNARDYDGCAALFDELMAAQFDAALLRDAVADKLDQLGAFSAYQKTVAYSAEQNGTLYAVVVLVADYEGGTVQYTVSLNKAMEVAGFYYK